MLDKLKSFVSKKLAGGAALVAMIEQSSAPEGWKVACYAVIAVGYFAAQAYADVNGAKP